MIDIHCHILPGLDDGPKSMEESLEMAKAAVQAGIHTIIATPHHANGTYDNPSHKVLEAVQHLKDHLRESRIPLNIIPGQEVRIHKLLIDGILNQSVISLAQQQYILLEFPTGAIPPDIEELLHELRVLRLVPIIAHPERHRDFILHPERLYSLIESGALSQLTAHSLTGFFGRKIQKVSINLCRHQLVHFIASDAHNVSRRSFHLSEAYEHLHQKLGRQYVEYFQNNAQCLVEQRSVAKWDPIRPTHKRFMFWKTS